MELPAEFATGPNVSVCLYRDSGLVQQVLASTLGPEVAGYSRRTAKTSTTRPVKKPLDTAMGSTLHCVTQLREMDSKTSQATSKLLTRAERVRQSSRQRRAQQKEALRRTILEAAGELFLEFGYEGFSMRQVAERIGYSATTIYRYFENKDDLLFAIIREAFIQFRQELAAAARTTDDALARIEALGHAYINFGLQNPVHYQLMFMQRTDFLLANRDGQKQPMIDSFKVLQQAVEQAMDAGVIECGDAETCSEVIWALVHGITSLAVAKSPRFSAARIWENAQLAMRMALRGLRRE